MTRGFYKHINGMDMVIEVLAAYSVNPGYIKIKYKCLVEDCYGELYYAPAGIMKATIFKEDLGNWTQYEVDRDV